MEPGNFQVQIKKSEFRGLLNGILKLSKLFEPSTKPTMMFQREASETVTDRSRWRVPRW